MRGNLISGALGGAVVLLAGGTLAATGVLGASGANTTAGAPSDVGLTAVAQAAGGGDRTVGQIYEQAGPGVVSIAASRGQGQATGSGFVLDEQGFILTNAHVVDGASSLRVEFEGEDSVGARLVGADVSSDLALLKVDPDDAELRALALGDSDAAAVGDLTVAIGSPFGQEGTVTAGIVSAKQRQISAPNGFSIDRVIQTDAAINPGNSGGPLLDGQGRVIGINSQIASNGSRSNSGIGFAVPVNTAKEVVAELKDDGRVEHAYLGVSSAEVTEAIRDERRLRVDSGAFVREAVSGAPAQRAGLRAGDVITRVDDVQVTEPGDIARAIADREPGDEVTIEFRRGALTERAEVRLGNQPTQARQG